MMTSVSDFLLTRIVKCDGSIKAMDVRKIESALLRAGCASGEFDMEEAKILSAQVVHALLKPYGENQLHIEEIQNAVEAALCDAGYRKTLRAYIVYREQHQKLRRDRKTLVDVESSMNEYLEQLDWRVNANANQGYSLGGLILNVRSEEHTSELQSLMRISYAVYCLKKKKQK